MLCPSPARPPRCFQLTVSWATLLKLSIFAAVVFLFIKLLHLLGLLLLAMLIAITVSPLADFVCRRGGPKWLGILFCSFIVFGSVGLFLFVATPIAAAQIAGLIKTLPVFKDHLLQHLPATGEIHDLAEGLLSTPAFAKPEPMLEKSMDWGLAALRGIIELFVVLVVAIYLVADGPRVYAWLVAFLPPRQQSRVAAAGAEASRVVFSYMAGQVITSVLCGAYLWATLALLGVPNALLLAIIGGVLDILPLIGFFLALAPAVAMAATVAPGKAVLVVGLYTFYHLVENYFIVPRVYGNRLRLSTLTVIIACLAAGLVGGIVAVIVILPIIASFPIVERIWLRPVLGPETVARHDEIEEEAHPET